MGLAKELVWKYRRMFNLLTDYRTGLTLREYYRYGYRTMKYNGMEFNLRLNLRDRSISKRLLRDSWWDLCTSDFLLSNVKQGMIAVDAGANIGFFTILMAKLIGETGKVYAFEPEITNFSVLEENVQISGVDNVRLYNMALGATDGLTSFYIPFEHTNGRAYRSEGEEWRNAIRREIEIHRLDTLLGVNTLLGQQIDVLKIDTEGMDLEVLKGAEKLLGDKALVVVEVWPSTNKAILAWLNEKGFRIVGDRQLGYDNKDFINIYAVKE